MAVFLTALYALTVLAPHAAVAMVGPQGLVHCLTQHKAGHDHGPVSADAHVHADGTAHSHADKAASDGDDQKGPAVACCGLFTVGGIMSETRVDFPTPVMTSRVQPFSLDTIDGQGPGRINRPPIA